MEWKITKTEFLDSLKNGDGKTLVDSMIDAGFDINWEISGKTLLSIAAEYGDLEFIEYLVLEKGADSNATNLDGTNPLHIAAKYSHQKAVEFFINLGVCVDSRDNNNRTPLHYAGEVFHRQAELSSRLKVFSNSRCSLDKNYTKVPKTCPASEMHMELVRFLLVIGADFDAIDSNGDVPLLLAAKYSCAHVVKILVTFGANIKCRDDKKWTTLHYASYNGWLDVVSLLVEKGINVNAKTKNGDRPISLAFENSFENVIEILLRAKAYSRIKGRFECMLLSCACEEGWLNVVQCLVDIGIDVNEKPLLSRDAPILLAIEYSHRAIFDLLVKSGANLTESDWYNTTVLHHACRIGWLDVAQLLVDRGSDINAVTNTGLTPVLLAVRNSHKDIFFMLLKAGAHLNTCESNTWTCLHYACRVGWLDVVQYLLETGFDINAKNFDGKTPLVIAAEYSNFDIFNHLLEAGADVYVKFSTFPSRPLIEAVSDDGMGWTVLHHASYDGCLEVVESLVKKKVNINLKTSRGETPLHLASQMTNFDVIKYLLEAGADCNIEDTNYATPLTYLARAYPLYNAETIRLFLEHGSCIDHFVYDVLNNIPNFKEDILQDAKICTQAIINQFNRDLERLYEQYPLAAEHLPPVERMKIKSNRNMVHCIEQSVRHEIETNQFCNIVEIRPIVLSLLSLRSYIG